MKYFLVLVLVFALLLGGCGYKWGYRGRQLPGGSHSVHVAVLKNQTDLLGLGAAFTQALNKELERSGFAHLAPKEKAQLLIKGRVISASVEGSGSDPHFVGEDFSSENPQNWTSSPFTAPFFTTYTLRISLSLEAIRSEDHKKIWQTSLSGSRSFQSARLKRQGTRSSNVLYNEARKKQTVKRLAQDMMNDVFDRLTENF